MSFLRSQRGQSKATPALLLAGATALAGILYALAQGTNTAPITTTATRACIGWDHTPGATQTLRCLTVYLPGKVLQLIGVPGIQTDAQGNPLGEYVAMEVQAEGPGNPDVLGPLRDAGLSVDTDSCTSRVTPLAPTCQVAFVRPGDALYPTTCACGPDCSVTDAARGWSATTGHRGLTFQPGTWTAGGPNCIKKPCSELAGQDSMPSACK